MKKETIKDISLYTYMVIILVQTNSMLDKPMIVWALCWVCGIIASAIFSAVLE